VQIYQQAPLFIAEVRAAMAGEVVSKPGSGSDREGQGALDLPPLRSLAEFHNDPRYVGDLHRADLAWARHAAGMGLSESEIRAAILETRDLGKKGSIRRQREYAERTAGKAFRQAELGQCREPLRTDQANAWSALAERVKVLNRSR
jgi:hypothetical protein